MAKKNFFSKIRVSYNAPATLTFAILSALILFFNQLLSGNLIPALFTAPGSATCKVPFNFSSFLDYVRLFTHVLGHSDWNHFLSNMAFILLLGPVIEERYGSPIVVLMMSITALVTGVLNACFSPTQLLGSSDIAFMMILLTSFTSITKKEIPLSFILVLVLNIGREILNSGINQNISTLAHIAGGICGSLFAFLATPRPKTAKDGKEIKETKTGKSYNKKNDDPDKTMQPEALQKRLEEIDSQSPRFAKKRKGSYEDDTTVVGSIEL